MPSLVMVPSTWGVLELDLRGSANFVVLDDLLMCGMAGVYFRRLRVAAAMNAQVRHEYDGKRHSYLRMLLASKYIASGTVFIGTHPTDVDLLDFGEVSAVRIADDGLRTLSRKVYGDTAMLHLEYLDVLRSLADSIDAWHSITSYYELAMCIRRAYGVGPKIDFSVSHDWQMYTLRAILKDEPALEVWLQPSIGLDVPLRQFSLIDDCDYLSAIHPLWRDAVLKMIGRAPSIERLFKLPWFMVDSLSLHVFCYRVVAGGRKAVATRGMSIVSYVQRELASVISPREFIGTWIGALLSDDAVAMETSIALQGQPIAFSAAAMFSSNQCDDLSLVVPQELSWAYEAVPNVVVRPWEGVYDDNGNIVLFPDGSLRIASLMLANCYRHESTKRGRASVIRLMSRLHKVNASDRLYLSLVQQLRDLHNGAICDVDLVPMLPGYEYLWYFGTAKRDAACKELGSYPEYSVVVQYVASNAMSQGMPTISQLCGELARMGIFAGIFDESWREATKIHRPVSVEQPGYCYLTMFQEDYHLLISAYLGPLPTLRDVLDARFKNWRIPDCFNSIIVSGDIDSIATESGMGTLHFERGSNGLSLQRVIQLLGPDLSTAEIVASTLLVGQIKTCTGVPYAALIVGWTIVLVAIVGIGCWFVYLKYGGSRRRRF